MTELKAYHEYFKVSFEYLMGETDVKTVDEDIQAACKVTGLSEKALETIRRAPCVYTADEGEKMSSKILSSLLENSFFQVAVLNTVFLIPIAQDMVKLENDTTRISEHYELSRKFLTGKQETDELFKLACSSVIKQYSGADADELMWKRYKFLKEGAEHGEHNPTP